MAITPIGFMERVVPSEAVFYEYGPFSSPMLGTRPGATLEVQLPPSDVFPGVQHQVWVHIPYGVDHATPVNFCVFQDGWLYLDPSGPVRAGTVLDNLHARGFLQRTIGIFVAPGVSPSERPGGMKQRNLEYDPFTPDYGTFLRNEVLPVVGSRVQLADGPTGNFICGGSSGGNCAFTAAWYHSDVFEAAICFVSSFAQIPGGNPVPDVLSTAPICKRRLRVFQQIAHRDLYWDQAEDNWVAENFRVAAALFESGHDVRVVLGDGGHSPNHGGVLLPDALRWAAGTVGSEPPTLMSNPS